MSRRDGNYPTEGTLSAEQLQLSIEGMEQNCAGWLERIVKNGPRDLEAAKMYLECVSILRDRITLQNVYFRYAEPLITELANRTTDE